MKTPTKKPAKKTAPKQTPPPNRKLVARAANDDGLPRAYIFQSHMDGVPAVVAISTVNRSPREALGAAFLAADDFCLWAMKELNK